ncbi:hypothetical protein MTR62_19325 [Novosphingobium sp. 1949]|uniref:DUF4124 domain-containing protein n=1 Tax=Novosphingobium organovorum TaxID=2930092 RepID=A0ABT0BID2_9SPHN|nr:hypothetical protein [Novosphingobium organovorum]MCJ2184825.1 hypothetical protein [Novosphingobium organovorum]
MSRLLTTAAALAAMAAGLTLAAAPAAAQDDDDGGDRINQVIVYGDDPCPKSTGNEITVCARKPEEERYRIPEPLRGIDSPQAQTWSSKVQSYETVGAFGTMSCSPVGAGGATGCEQQLIDKAYAQKKNGSDVKFSELIDKERQRRLSTIDATAAKEQAQVEKEEDAYFAKKEAEEKAAEAAKKDTSGTDPQP